MARPLSLSWNFRGRGAKIDKVPVPVLEVCQDAEFKVARGDERRCTYRSGRRSPLSKISRTRSRYWYSSCDAVGAIVATGISGKQQ